MEALKKISINILLVAIVVFVLDFATGKILEINYFNSVAGENYRTTYVMEETKADILVIGSSQAKYNYIPTIFQDSLNLSCYNAGKNFSVLFYENVILNAVLKRYLPKVIILDYSGGREEENGAYSNLSSVEPYYRTHKEIRDVVELKGPYEKVKLLSKIYPYNSEVYKIFRNTKFSEKRRTVNGHIPMVGHLIQEMDTIKELHPYQADENIVNATIDFLKLAKYSGSKVIVISSPVYLKFKQKQEIDFIRDICKEQNITYWNFSQDTVFLNNKKYFNDIIHLNQEGATLFTNIVVNQLKKELD